MSDITINEVRRLLQGFAKEHANDRGEKQYAQQFMRDFYACFGLSKSSASMFEKKVIKLSKKNGFIDSFIPGVLLVEQKTTGENLTIAYQQALDYAMALENEFEKPQYILVCDFQTFHLYNLHSLDKEPLVCKLDELRSLCITLARLWACRSGRAARRLFAANSTAIGKENNAADCPSPRNHRPQGVMQRVPKQTCRLVYVFS